MPLVIKNLHTVQLLPGALLVFSNHRVLHGIREHEKMYGIAVERKEWERKLMKLEGLHNSHRHTQNSFNTTTSYTNDVNIDYLYDKCHIQLNSIAVPQQGTFRM